MNRFMRRRGGISSFIRSNMRWRRICFWRRAREIRWKRMGRMGLAEMGAAGRLCQRRCRLCGIGMCNEQGLGGLIGEKAPASEGGRYKSSCFAVLGSRNDALAKEPIDQNLSHE